MTQNYWDGKHVHYCHSGPGQSAQEATLIVCGMVLSTWAGPNRRKDLGNGIEGDVGYTFENLELVDCPSCVTWIEANKPRCDGGCGRFVVYRTCCHCYDHCVCGALLLDKTAKWLKHENHKLDCTGREVKQR